MTLTTLRPIIFPADDLVYAPSARAVKVALNDVQGVVQFSANLAAREIQVTVLPGFETGGDWTRRLARAGVRVADSHSSDTRPEFTARAAVILGFTLTMALGLIRHMAVPTSAVPLPSFPLLASLEAVVLFGAGYPYFRRALALLLQRAWDVSLVPAILAMASFLVGVGLALFGDGGAWTWVVLLAAATLTSGWFVARGCTVWVLPSRAIRIQAMPGIFRNSAEGRN